jgi:hypothetical protein
MLMGKAGYRCDQDFTTIVMPAKCIETFFIGSAFPLNKAFGSVSAISRGGTIILVENTGAEQANGNVSGTYKRDEGKIEVILPIRVCEFIFKTEVPERELRIEVIDDKVLVSPV